MNSLNPFPCTKLYQREGEVNGSRSRSVVHDFTIMEARNIKLYKSGLPAYFSMHFIGIVLDTYTNSEIPNPSFRTDAVLSPLSNNHPPVHASQTIELGIHYVDAAIAVTG